MKKYFCLSKFLPKTKDNKVDLLNNEPRQKLLDHISRSIIRETNMQKLIEMRNPLNKIVEEIWKEEKNHRVANFRRIWLRGMTFFGLFFVVTCLAIAHLFFLYFFYHIRANGGGHLAAHPRHIEGTYQIETSSYH